MRPHHEDFRQRLLERRRQLLERYRSEQDRIDQELADREIEWVDNAQEQFDAKWLSRMSDLDKHRLDAVVAALRRIEAGSYGICTNCGAEIEHARLEALPETPLCIYCADEVAAEVPAPPH